MSDTFEILSERSCIRISGDDAELFLDNILTCQVVDLQSGEARFGALLTPQGKILFDFFLIKTEDGYLIDVAESLADEFVKRLTFYKLRAKVLIEKDPDLQVAVIAKDSLPDAIATIQDPRHGDMGSRSYGRFETDGLVKDYDKTRIKLGIPEGGKDFAYGDAYPHETLMDQFGGVDFKKGCYVGQEVVSRMQHRGTAKKRVVLVHASQPLPNAETPIFADGKPAGTLGTVVGQEGLALVRLDRVAKAENLEADGVSVEVHLPDWVTFTMPEAG